MYDIDGNTWALHIFVFLFHLMRRRRSAHSMSFNHFTEQIFDDTIIDNRITAISANDMKNHHDFLYPYNLTVFRTIPTLDNIRHATSIDADKHENSKSHWFAAGKKAANQIAQCYIPCRSVGKKHTQQPSMRWLLLNLISPFNCILDQ